MLQQLTRKDIKNHTAQTSTKHKPPTPNDFYLDGGHGKHTCYHMLCGFRGDRGPDTPWNITKL